MRVTKMRFILALPLFTLIAAHAYSGQVVSRTARGVGAVMQHNGFQLVPTNSPAQFRGDLAPPQAFQIVRPGNQRVTIGRLFTSCTCVQLESPKQTFEAGEPAILHLRNVRPTPPSGQIYAIYVQITSPIRTTLRFDTFVQSSQFVPASAGDAPTRGDIVIDGVLATVPETDKDMAATVVTRTDGSPSVLQGDDGIEIYVPKADNYIEDTSEYTLRKKAELDTAKSSVQDEQKQETADRAAAEARDGDDMAEIKSGGDHNDDDLWLPAVKRTKTSRTDAAGTGKTTAEAVAGEATETDEALAEKDEDAGALAGKAGIIEDDDAAKETTADAGPSGKDVLIESMEDSGERAAESLEETDAQFAEVADDVWNDVREKNDAVASAVEAIEDDAIDEMDALVDELAEEFEADAVSDEEAEDE